MTTAYPQVKRGRMTEEEQAQIEEIATAMTEPTAGKIARRLNRHPATVHWFLLTRGLISRPARHAPNPYKRNGATVHPYTAEADRRIEALRVEGKPFREIAEIITAEFGIKRTAHSVQVRLVQITAAP